MFFHLIVLSILGLFYFYTNFRNISSISTKMPIVFMVGLDWLFKTIGGKLIFTHYWVFFLYLGIAYLPIYLVFLPLLFVRTCSFQCNIQLLLIFNYLNSLFIVLHWMHTWFWKHGLEYLHVFFFPLLHCFLSSRSFVLLICAIALLSCFYFDCIWHGIPWHSLSCVHGRILTGKGTLGILSR